MKRNKRYIICICIIMSLSSCAYTNRGEMVTYCSNHFLLDDVETNNQAWCLYQDAYKDEMAKVRYLINCVRFSDVKFKRNGDIVPGPQAAQWLEYKVNKFYDEIHVVEDFIEEVGSYSRTSGKPYYVIYEDGCKVPIKEIFYKELNRLYELQEISV